MDKALVLLRGMCMACSACYNFDEENVKVFKSFKRQVLNETLVFKCRLLPISVLILSRVQFLFEEWVEKTHDHFRRKIEHIVAVVLEHQRLVRCLEYWSANLVKDMVIWKEYAKEVLDALYLDVRKFRTG